MRNASSTRKKILAAAALAAAFLGGAAGRLSGTCGPFLDVAPDAFCPFVLEVFTLAITTGTTATTYDPTSPVTRLQMAAFLSRSVDAVLTRNSRAAALNQFWTTQNESVLGLTTATPGPISVRSDGLDLWVSDVVVGTVRRIRGSDGRLLETWTGATYGSGVLAVMGQVLVLGNGVPGNLYRIDPSQPAGAVTTVATNVGIYPLSLDFDGERIWTANQGSISIVTPGPAAPWTVTTVSVGFMRPYGPVYDGSSVWISDNLRGALLRVDTAGSILQTVTIGATSRYPVFDGTNIWVPSSDSVVVVRASSGVVLQTLTGNGLSSPLSAAFDGRRVLVTNPLANSVSLWKAADMTPLGSFPTGTSSEPYIACSDGANFFITMPEAEKLARF